MSDDHETEQPPGEAHAGPGATEAARELAAANMVDLEQITGTGADGKITKADVEDHLAKTADAVETNPTYAYKDEPAEVSYSPPPSGGHAPKVWTGPRR